MLNFLNDYSEGCMPQILSRLEKTNYEKSAGYGDDGHCAYAAQLIKKLCSCPDAQVYFLSGGTQCNQVVIDVLLDAFDGVVTADTGHINVHEAGAIEYTGHKVMPLKHHDGKIDANELRCFIEDYYADGNYEHMVRPGMVYISHPTELGTIYSKEELTQISKVCREYSLPLFLDGARLACALAADGNDLSLADIAELTDVFYIGGTKCGALYGEAVVWTKNNMPFRFNTRVKQHGAMLAKGRILGLQFETLFSDGTDEHGFDASSGNDEEALEEAAGRVRYDVSDTLYYKGGVHAVTLANRIKEALHEAGYTFYVNSPTNQIFVIIENSKMQALAEKTVYSFFEKYDASHTVIRFVTSWATREEDVDELVRCLAEH